MQYFPQFAKGKGLWITTEKKAGKLSIILLKNTDNTNLYFEDLMASGIGRRETDDCDSRAEVLRFPDRRWTDVTALPQRQRNDFALGLIHETVHLEKENTANLQFFKSVLLKNFELGEKVDLNVVRELRRLNQPMNPRLIEADDALRSCSDKAECEALREILFPTETTR